MLEGLTFGAIACGILVDIISKQVETPANEIIESIRSAGIPRNHHIQRAVRRSALLATRNQINRYLQQLKAETGADLNPPKIKCRTALLHHSERDDQRM